MEAFATPNTPSNLWSKIGRLQLDFLKEQGVQPHYKLMDVGSGKLRLGALAVDFLDSGNYYAIDVSDELLDKAYNDELTDRQRERLPRSQLFATADFDFTFLQDRKMDVAIAQSLFTHLPLNHIRRCLRQLHPHMKPGSALYASFPLCPDHHDMTQPLIHPADESITKNVVTYDIQEPYHYTLEDLEYCAKDTPWKAQYIGDWGHPRNLKMMGFYMEG